MMVIGQDLSISEISRACHPGTRRMVGASETITPRYPPAFAPQQREPPIKVSRKLAGRPWFGETCTRLRELLSLGENWNGYDEQAISRIAVKRALNVLEIIGTEGCGPGVVPMFDGGLQLEWMGNGFEIEVEIPPEGPASVLIVDPEGAETEHSAWAQSEIWKTLREHITEMGREST